MPLLLPRTQCKRGEIAWKHWVLRRVHTESIRVALVVPDELIQRVQQNCEVSILLDSGALDRPERGEKRGRFVGEVDDERGHPQHVVASFVLPAILQSSVQLGVGQAGVVVLCLRKRNARELASVIEEQRELG